jgi:hypothetical protein
MSGDAKLDLRTRIALAPNNGGDRQSEQLACSDRVRPFVSSTSVKLSRCGARVGAFQASLQHEISVQLLQEAWRAVGSIGLEPLVGAG